MRIRTAVILSAALVVLGCADRALKLLALQVIPAEGFFVFNQTMGIRLEYNTGIAYGLVIGRPLAVIVLISVVILALGTFVGRMWQRRQWFQVVTVTAIIIGAISNVIDRIQYGSVIDYFYIAGMSRFNLADMMITGGVITWLWALWRHRLDAPPKVS